MDNMRVAIVSDETRIVENVAVADSGFNPGEGLSSIPSETAKVGDSWDGANFTTPAIVVPEDEYAAATSDAARIVVIAEHLGLVEKPEPEVVEE